MALEASARVAVTNAIENKEDLGRMLGDATYMLTNILALSDCLCKQGCCSSIVCDVLSAKRHMMVIDTWHRPDPAVAEVMIRHLWAHMTCMLEDSGHVDNMTVCSCAGPARWLASARKRLKKESGMSSTGRSRSMRSTSRNDSFRSVTSDTTGPATFNVAEQVHCFVTDHNMLACTRARLAEDWHCYSCPLSTGHVQPAGVSIAHIVTLTHSCPGVLSCRQTMKFVC